MNEILISISKIYKRQKDIDDQLYKLEIEKEEDFENEYPDVFEDEDEDDDGDSDKYLFGVPLKEEVKAMKEIKNIPIKLYRKYVKKSSGWINSDEQLVKILDDGNCFYTSIAVLHYGDKEQGNVVREEIVKYMMKMSFGDKYVENYQNYYKDFIDGNNIPELLTNKDINELWSSGIDAFIEDVEDINAPLNVKVAYVIADTMKGLKPNDIASWADNIIIPTFASLLYKVNICIYQIERDDDNFKTYDCTIDFGSLIKYNENKKIYKLIFYNKGRNNHFDVIIKK